MLSCSLVGISQEARMTIFDREPDLQPSIFAPLGAWFVPEGDGLPQDAPDGAVVLLVPDAVDE